MRGRCIMKCDVKITIKLFGNTNKHNIRVKGVLLLVLIPSKDFNTGIQQRGVFPPRDNRGGRTHHYY